MHIAFEGPIAAGKTTLATLFAQRLGSGAELILESFDSNPFLRDFYDDSSRWALPMQLDFLLARHAQLGGLPHITRQIVADHSMVKERVFASLLLNGRDLALYRRVAAALPPPTRTPDLVVYLDAPVTKLLKRIALRGRLYEARIDAAYLEALRESYDVQLALMPGQKVLRLDTSCVDLCDEVQLQGLWHEITTEAKSAISKRQEIAD